MIVAVNEPVTETLPVDASSLSYEARGDLILQCIIQKVPLAKMIEMKVFSTH